VPQVDVPDIPRTERLELPADRTALIVVDMQNDFVHPEGALHVPDAAATLPRIRDLASRARTAGARVVYTQDWHPDPDPEFEVWPRHAVMGSWGAEIVEELDVASADRVIRKPRYDAFYGTPLDHLLRLWNVRHVVVVGTVANICVQHTAASAALRWYDVVVAEDGVSALTPFDLSSTLRQLTFLYLGRVAPSAGIAFADAAGS
jgi:nicotinamidase-related amidase